MSSHDAAASRRAFLKTAAATTAAFHIGRAAGAQETAPLKAGVIGLGKRGCGAAKNFLDAAPNLTITAIGDLFPDVLAAARGKLATLGDAFQAADDTCFSGWDAYRKVIDSGVDVVLLCAPPGFRPQHLAAAVAAGKHVFMEKPAATDPAGVRAVLAAAEEATKRGLSIVAGTQRRHQKPYLDTIARVHDGAIGPIVSAQAYWIGDYDYYPGVPKQEGWSDVEWQIRNWNYFTWLSGDHIVEQHVHNLDIMNWALQATPVKAIGVGGRQQRVDPVYGHIFDHFAVQFEYPGQVQVTSICRQMKDCKNRVEEFLIGAEGVCNPRRGIEGRNPFAAEDGPDPYTQEHTDLVNAVRSGTPINEAAACAHSTLAAIMGRMACYTGQEVTWDWALNESQESLFPNPLEFGPLPTPPVAMPGVTKLV